MTDYVDVIVHTPLFTYHLLQHLASLVLAMPWPEPSEWFGSAAIFLGLYPIRLIVSAVVPEKTIKRRIYRRRKSVPDRDDHQAGATAAGNILHHL